MTDGKQVVVRSQERQEPEKIFEKSWLNYIEIISSCYCFHRNVIQHQFFFREETIFNL